MLSLWAPTVQLSRLRGRERWKEGGEIEEGTGPNSSSILKSPTARRELNSIGIELMGDLCEAASSRTDVLERFRI